MSDRASASWLQDERTAGQGPAHQRRWDNTVKKGAKKTPKQQQLLWERGVRLCERNNSADTKASEGAGEEVLQAQSRDSPAPVEKTMVRQAVPSMEGSPHLSRWMTKGGCDPVGSPC